MSIFQIAYLTGLAVAVWWGRPDWRLVALLLANFVGTMTFASSPYNVAILDLVTACLFIVIGTGKAKILAAVFGAVAAVCVFGKMAQLSHNTIYAIVEISALAIFGVVASGGGGAGNRISDLDSRRASISRPVEVRSFMARRSSEDH